MNMEENGETKKKLGITLGYDFIPSTVLHDFLGFLEDSPFTHVFIPELWGYDALIEASWMLNHTNKLIIGTGIVNIFSRSPSTLAQAAASLYELSNRRFVLGLGLSGPKVIKDWHGNNYYGQSPIERTREYLEIIRLIHSGERVNYDGLIYSLKRFRLRSFDTPVNVPLFVAAMGHKNVQLVGELADGWIPIWTSYPELPGLRQALDKGLRQRNKRLSKNIEIAPYLITCVTTDPKSKLLVQKHLALYIGGMGTFYNRIVRQFGFTEEAKTIKSLWNEGKKHEAALSITDEMLAKLAVVGTPEEIIERYNLLNKKGVTLPVMWLPLGTSIEVAMETISAFVDYW